VGGSGSLHGGFRCVFVELLGAAAADDGCYGCDEDGNGSEADDCEYACYFAFV
jgi:hypothetical protein